MNDTETIELPGMPETERRGGCSSPASCSPIGAIVTDLPEKHYRTIVIDPPWPGPTEHRSGKGGGVVLIPYQCMTGIQLAAMNIASVATDDAQLWLWATSRHVGDAQLLMQLWAFSYAGCFIWKKPPGLGPWIRHDSEFLLRGVRRGSEIKLPAPQQTHEWPRPKRHSEKPPEAYRMIEEYSPGPRLDIFARQPRPGFDAWGNQAPGISANSFVMRHPKPKHKNSKTFPSARRPETFVPYE